MLPYFFYLKKGVEKVSKNKNLIKLTPEQAREAGRKGGIASGKARRKKADLRKAFEMLLSEEATDDTLKKELRDRGYEDSNEMALALVMLKAALEGDVRAFKEISNLVARKDLLDIEEQQEKIKLIRKQAESSSEVAAIPIFINDMKDLEDE